MICNRCGKELPNGSTFCNFCGTQQTAQSQPVEVNFDIPNYQQAPQVKQPAPAKKNKSLGIAGIILGIVLIISGGYKIYMGLWGNDKKADAKAQASAGVIGENTSDKDGVSFCVISAEDSKTLGEDYAEITTEDNYIVINIKITNNSESPYDVNSLRFLLKEGENEYEYCGDALLAFDNFMSMDTINPGLSKEYIMVYETPYSTEERNWQMKIKNNAFSEDDCVYINL